MEMKRATVENYRDITELYEELMKEIYEKTNTPLNLPPHSQSLDLCKQYLERGIYIVFILEIDKQIVGFISLCPSHSLYAGGEFGIIQELFVRSAYRSNKLGSKLLTKAKEYGKQERWKRIEVATPPLPQFDQSFMFYENNGFRDGNGRKMRLIL